MLTKFSLACAVFVLMAGLDFASARSSKRIEVHGVLKAELNAVLQSASDLHSACFDQSESGIESSLQAALDNIEKAQLKSSLAKEQRPHLVKILQAAQSQLEMSQMQSGKDRRKSLKNAFKEFVQIAKVFKLDKYRIFFCPKDRSVWLQKGWKAQNPIHPGKHKNCGRLVP